MGTRLSINTPADYLLRRDLCSYGYFLLAPNHWDPGALTLSRPLELDDGPAACALSQPDGRGTPLRARFDRALTRAEQRTARAQITRMLRLDEDHNVIKRFHRADPRWKRSGRGRLSRSPTLFEDVIKTVTSCNVAWPSSIIMNTRLCAVLGRAGAFPRPSRIARTRTSTLRARCNVGYRDARIRELARLFESGDIDARWLEDPATPDDDVHEFLLSLPGVGPYAAANIMQLLGRYARLPLDTESLRHARAVLDMNGPDRALLAAMHDHYAPFGEHAFRSYWFELWRWYESKRGPAWTWQRETTGKTFTAALLRD